MANRLQDPTLLLNAHLIYSNEVTASINASPSALFINPNSLLHAAQQPAPSHRHPPSMPGALRGWRVPALLPACRTAPSPFLMHLPEAAFAFSGSQTLQEHLALPQPYQVYNIQQARDAP